MTTQELGKEESRNYSLYVNYSSCTVACTCAIKYTMLLINPNKKSFMNQKLYKHEYAPSSKKVS